MGKFGTTVGNLLWGGRVGKDSLKVCVCLFPYFNSALPPEIYYIIKRREDGSLFPYYKGFKRSFYCLKVNSRFNLYLI